jgi:hypothetical protein
LNRISKNLSFSTNVAKNSGLSKSSHAMETFQKQLFAFKRRRKYHRWIPVNPIVLKGRTLKTFEIMTNALEEFRCSLGMSSSLFYKIVAEFIVIPTGRKYYPLREIFNDENPASEEFIVRIADVMPWIADITSWNFSDSKIVEVLNFSKELLIRKIDTGSATVFKSKDWFCVCAIMEQAEKKNWSREEILERIRIYYKRRMKKVTPEMVLSDITHRELEGVNLNNIKQKKQSKETHIDIIKKQDWYEPWLKDVKRKENS